MDKDDLSQLEKQELLLRRGKIPSGPQRATFAFAGSVKILSNSSGREADVANITVCYFLGSRSRDRDIFSSCSFTRLLNLCHSSQKLYQGAVWISKIIVRFDCFCTFGFG
ncbi:hypothetical protein LLR08_22240 [Rouxiella badensis]|uniref:hypothetical protein n=1 Tax=Rouxiella badensis TaxID=1646377 RepID=UPI001D146E87|nr:hypothetical protein [Rouxiella badensis]MCC3705263.1 hypothetical protein [Rouxiella badensis]